MLRKLPLQNSVKPSGIYNKLYATYDKNPVCLPRQHLPFPHGGVHLPGSGRKTPHGRPVHRILLRHQHRGDFHGCGQSRIPTGRCGIQFKCTAITCFCNFQMLTTPKQSSCFGFQFCHVFFAIGKDPEFVPKLTDIGITLVTPRHFLCINNGTDQSQTQFSAADGIV